MQNLKSENLAHLITQLGESGISIDLESQQMVLPDWCNSIKIDVGLSHNAPMTIEWLRRQPQGLIVFCFEPIKRNIESSKNALGNLFAAKNLHSKAVLLQFALGQFDGLQKMYVTPDAGQSSFLVPKRAEIVSEEEVRVTRLDALLSLIDWNRMPRVDYLKTDCQGTDIEVLRGSGELIRKLAVITSEADSGSYRGSNNGGKLIAKYLKAKGFEHINPRPAYKQLLGELIKLNDTVHGLYLKLFRKRTTAQKGASPTISTEDPTFVNSSFLGLIQEGRITAFQKG